MCISLVCAGGSWKKTAELLEKIESYRTAWAGRDLKDHLVKKVAFASCHCPSLVLQPVPSFTPLFHTKTCALVFIPFPEKHKKAEGATRSSCLQLCLCREDRAWAYPSDLCSFPDQHWLMDPRTAELSRWDKSGRQMEGLADCSHPLHLPGKCSITAAGRSCTPRVAGSKLKSF